MERLLVWMGQTRFNTSLSSWLLALSIPPMVDMVCFHRQWQATRTPKWEMRWTYLTELWEMDTQRCKLLCPSKSAPWSRPWWLDTSFYQPTKWHTAVDWPAPLGATNKYLSRFLGLCTLPRGWWDVAVHKRRHNTHGMTCFGITFGIRSYGDRWIL